MFSIHLKVLEHRQNTLLEEKRKQLLSMQLDFLVGQSEQFSSWLVEGLASTSSAQRSATRHPASIRIHYDYYLSSSLKNYFKYAISKFALI